VLALQVSLPESSFVVVSGLVLLKSGRRAQEFVWVLVLLVVVLDAAIGALAIELVEKWCWGLRGNAYMAPELLVSFVLVLDVALERKIRLRVDGLNNMTV
jgi:hypothetical protein